MSAVVPPAKVPIAVNCCVWPRARLMLGLTGVTAIEVSAATVSVKVWATELPPLAAVDRQRVGAGGGRRRARECGGPVVVVRERHARG